MKRSILKFTFVLLLLGTVFTAAIFLIERKPVRREASTGLQKNPPDVEVLARDFHYFSDEGNLSVEIRGRTFVRRGVRFLHVRSNVFKKNYLRDVSGRIRKKDGEELTFMAKEAELNEGEIILKKDVKLGKEGQIFDVEGLRIDLKTGVLTRKDGTTLKIY